MNRRISLALMGAIIIPLVAAAFVVGLVFPNLIGRPAYAQKSAEAASSTSFVTPEGESPFVKVSEDVIPAVVNISAEKTTQQFDQFFPKDFFKDFPFPFPTPPSQKGQSVGSGVIISPDGYIVTNNHVVSGVEKITVTLEDKTKFQGSEIKVVGTDPMTDIALLKVESKEKLPYAEWGDSDSVKVGDWAIAIGNPFGLNGTVTVGVISAKGRSGIPLPEGPNLQDFLQTDASINPGNSGGPLIDIKGRVIGINSAIRSTVGANVGIGFAVPSNMARQVTDDLRSTGRIAHGYLGIRPAEVTESVKDAMGLESTEGVLVNSVEENTPASRAGLQTGDVILTFDGKKITDVPQFRRLVAGAAPGKPVALVVVRDGKKKDLKAELAEYPVERLAAQPAPPKTWHGIEVASLTAQDRERLGIASGVLVKSVVSGSAAEDAGIEANDVITKIVVRSRNLSEKVDDLSDFSRVTGQLEGYTKAIAVHLWRNKMTQIIALTPEK